MSNTGYLDFSLENSTTSCIALILAVKTSATKYRANLNHYVALHKKIKRKRYFYGKKKKTHNR